MFSIKFVYDRTTNNATYALYPVIRSGVTDYIVKQDILTREFNDITFEKLMDALTERISECCIIDFVGTAELRWSTHMALIEKPSERYPYDLLFHPEPDERNIESICIHMNSITETPDDGIEVSVNMCYYDPCTVVEGAVKCFKVNI